MNISLREITPQNFKESIDLSVAESQRKFVASNLYSIAQSKIYPAMRTTGVYDGEKMVGFVMFGFDDEDGRFCLLRLMTDEKYQGQGFGRSAVLKVIEEMRGIKDCREIYLSFVPENTVAERLYESIGFRRTGEISHGEVVMCYDLTDEKNRKSQI